MLNKFRNASKKRYNKPVLKDKIKIHFKIKEFHKYVFREFQALFRVLVTLIKKLRKKHQFLERIAV